MKRTLFTIVILLCASAAFAQTPQVEVGKPFKALFDSTPSSLISGYRLYLCPGTVADCPTKLGADIPTSALQAGTVSVDVAALATRGPYTLQASAFNADKESKSAPLSFQAVLQSPPAPSQPRLVIVASVGADGHTIWDYRIIDGTLAEQVLASNQ